MPFENVVRPFQLPDVAPPRQYVDAKQSSQPPIMLYFGRSGSGKSFSGSYSSITQRYLTQIAAEDNRAYSG